MTGRLGRNLRRGNLAEGLGAELIRPFAAVAPVPRSEDVGVDAIATLLRPDGHSLYAEDSFYVQIKASSIRKREYVGENFTWLRMLRIPLFIASVDLASGQIELYTTHNAVSRTAGDAKGGAVLFLDPTPSRIDDRVYLDLGPPVMRWNAAEAAGAGFPERAYCILKPWLQLEQRNLALRELSTHTQINWETNVPPVASTTCTVSWAAFPEKLSAQLEYVRPYVEWLVSTICFSAETRTVAEAALEVLKFTHKPDGRTGKISDDELRLRLGALAAIIHKHRGITS